MTVPLLMLDTEVAASHDSAAKRRHGASLPTISVLIPVLNDAAGIVRCLKSIHANGYPAELLEIVVADNGSSDDTPEAAARHGARVVNQPGLPVAAVRNRLAAMATGDVLAFVDADHELSPNWLLAAVEALRVPGVAAAGAPYHPPLDATWVQRAYDAFRAHHPTPVDARWLGSGNLVVWADKFRTIGGFDTALVTCEDVDFCQKLRTRAGRLVADERLFSIHHGDPRTLRQLFNSELWRGRDNLRVSLRGPLELRELPSLVIPIALLACLAGLPVGVFLAASGNVWLLSMLVGMLAAVPALRSVAMTRRLRDRSLRALVQTFAVATTYDVARALALVVRKGHRRAVCRT